MTQSINFNRLLLLSVLLLLLISIPLTSCTGTTASTNVETEQHQQDYDNDQTLLLRGRNRRERVNKRAEEEEEIGDHGHGHGRSHGHDDDHHLYEYYKSPPVIGDAVSGNSNQLSSSSSSLSLSTSLEEKHGEFFKNLVERMKPHVFELEEGEGQEEGQAQIEARPRQFYHLHHMKTGGTSLSNLISCATRRYETIYQRFHGQEQGHGHNNNNDKAQANTQANAKAHIPSFRLSECSKHGYERCVMQKQESCRNSIESAAVMTYCAPLAITDYFNWGGTHGRNTYTNSAGTNGSNTRSISSSSSSSWIPSVTMLRDPVNRVWSMYRFQMKYCYQCKPLLQIYDDIDNGNTDQYSGICLPQITNHLTRNLLTNLTFDELNNYTSTMTDEQKVNDAIHSVRNRFTVVGILERLEESLDLFSYSFPWLSEDIRDLSSLEDLFNGGDHHHDTMNMNSNFDWKSAIDETESTCTFPHSNSSPRNNGCGEGRTHLDVPSQPDEETRRVIEQHNMLDKKVYEAALDHFELQKLAVNWVEGEGFE
mmetsp:Transcript_5215/g.7716  ORF Transcript_5215/g.7716 Transcript_5215/m.7716 type:complete len:537 (-) Transcript_5215:183-1793(-)